MQGMSAPRPAPGYYIEEPGGLPAKCEPMLACSGSATFRADIDLASFTYKGLGNYRGEYGDANCLEGYSGYRCATCRVTIGTPLHGIPAPGDPSGNGYYRLDKRCQPCGEPLPAELLAFAAVAVFIGTALVADRILSKAKNLSQVLAPMLILLTFFRASPATHSLPHWPCFEVTILIVDLHVTYQCCMW